jgi:hypothetical protein
LRETLFTLEQESLHHASQAKSQPQEEL